MGVNGHPDDAGPAGSDHRRYRTGMRSAKGIFGGLTSA
jgi:hypothetical protein